MESDATAQDDRVDGKADGKGKPAPGKRPSGKRPPNRRIREVRDVTPAALEGLHSVVVLAVSGAMLFVPERYHPTQEEIDSIFRPAERIYLRHADVPEVSEDTRDVLALVMGIAGYSMRIMQATAAAMPPPPVSAPPSGADGRGFGPPPPPDVGDESRWSRPGEETGLRPDQLVGEPEEVLANLHRASFIEREDGAA